MTLLLLFVGLKKAICLWFQSTVKQKKGLY
nr:MAG TPA: hypothetical protein [Caudoviricetes sp.]